SISVYNSSGRSVASADSDGSGHYTTSPGLPAGTYFARTSNWLGYVNELYNDITCLGCDATNGAPIAITTGATAGGINFALAMGGRIAGTVTDAATGSPIA